VAAPTWEELELPALLWVHTAAPGPAGYVETGDLHRGDDLAEAVPELTELQLDDALYRLQRHGLIEGDRGETSDLVFWTGLRPTANGLRVLGEWPPVENAAINGALVKLLRALAADLPAEEATATRRAGSALSKMSADVLLDVMKDQAARLGEDIAS
jgi:hypothetical protein